MLTVAALMGDIVLFVTFCLPEGNLDVLFIEIMMAHFFCSITFTVTC